MAWLSNWRFRRPFAIDHNDVSANLSHFPTLLELDTSSGITGVNLTGIIELLGGGNSQKIAVTQSDGVTELYVEVEKWYKHPTVQVGNYAALWTSKAGWTINSGSDTVGYLYYDKAKPDNTANVGLCADGSVPTEGVWDSNFKLACHMKDATTSTVLDSTSNDNDGAKKAAGEPATQFSEVGDCQKFDGVDDYINFGNDASLRVTADLTEELVSRGDDVPAGLEGLMGIWETTANKRAYTLYTNLDRLMRAAISEDGTWTAGNRNEVYNIAVYQAVTSYHHLHTWSAATRPGDLYRDGVNVTTDSTNDVVNAINSDDANLYVGCHLVGGVPARFWDGRIDEVRVSDVVRPAEYITACWETQRDHFLTWGAEEKFGLRRLKQGVGL